VNSSVAKQVGVSGPPQFGELAFGSGWNLVGLKANQGTTVAALATKHPEMILVWKWEGGKWSVNLPPQGDTGAGYATSKGFTHLNEIKVGEGFWVNQ